MTDTERAAFEHEMRKKISHKDAFDRHEGNGDVYAYLTTRVAWEAWQARAALAASQEKAEPVAEVVPSYVPSGKRIAFRTEHQHLPIGTKLYLTPQPSAEAVRDAALEEAANTATGFLVGDPLAGIPLRNPMTHEIAAAIRALKSAPPQPAEQPSASPAALTGGDEKPNPLCRLAWSGFNLEGDKASIEEVKRLLHCEHRMELLQREVKQIRTLLPAPPAALEAELIAALRWAIDEAHAQKLAGIAGPLSRILARAQGEQSAPGAREGA